MSSPANAGKMWTQTEDADLLRAFESGASIDELARQQGRTPQAIYGRLYRHGKVPAWRPGVMRNWSTSTASPPPACTAQPVSTTVRLDGLNAAARSLVRADFSPDELTFILRAEIASLQQDAGQQIAVRDGRGGIWFAFTTSQPCRGKHPEAG